MDGAGLFGELTGQATPQTDASPPGAPRHAREAGKAQYKTRTICECIHARWRNWDLRQFTVRGIE